MEVDTSEITELPLEVDTSEITDEHRRIADLYERLRNNKAGYEQIGAQTIQQLRDERFNYTTHFENVYDNMYFVFDPSTEMIVHRQTGKFVPESLEIPWAFLRHLKPTL